MANAKKTKPKTAKKTISFKRVIEYDGQKHEVKISKTEKINPNLNDFKKDILNADNLPKEITSLNIPAEEKTNDVQPLAFNNAIDKTVQQKDVAMVVNKDTKEKANINKKKEVFSLVKKNNNLKRYELELLKLKRKSENYKKEKLVLDKLIVKNVEKPFYKTKVQFGNIKVIEKDNTNKMLTGIATACLILLLVVVSRFFIADNIGLGGETFDKGTFINGVQVGGLHADEVSRKLTQTYNEKAEDFKLTLTYEDRSWTFDKNDFKVSSNIHTIIEEALARDKANENYETQKSTVTRIKQNGNNIQVAFNYIFVGLDKKIDEIAKQIEYEPHDSTIVFKPNVEGSFIITDHRTGLKVNKEQLYNDINEQFYNTNHAIITIPTIVVEPNVTKEYNQSLTKKISEYSTNVSDSTGSRKHNVKLALQRINGLTVQPGEEVSFNKLTGPHTLQNGYEVATIIFNGQYVDGVGGGICQASTTLYNALLKADVEILQVSKPTLPVKYVPLALDAMVSEGVADLRFKNNSNYPIFIKTSANSESVKVEIFSHELDHGMTLKTRSEVVRKIPHSGDIIKKDTRQQYTDKVLFEGEQYRLSYPRDGYEAKAYVEYYKDGKFVTEKLIRHEIYYPQQGVIIEGAEKKPASFKEIENTIKQIMPNDEVSQDTFLFNLANGLEEIDAIPTNYCP